MTTELEFIPTHNTWTLYAHYLSNANSYQTSYIKMCDVASFQDFGRMWNHTHPRLIGDATRAVHVQGKRLTTWSFFKDNISPEWEDSLNKNGVTYSFRKGMSCDDVYNLWETLVASCTLSTHPCELNGIQVSRKTTTVCPHEPGLIMKFDLWFTSVSSHNEIEEWLSHLVPNCSFSHTPRTTTQSHRI